MKRWALIEAGTVSVITTQAVQPAFPGNWVECTGQPVGPGAAYIGGIFTTAPAVPVVVTKRQAREALIDAGLLAAAEAALNAIPDPVARAKALNNWEHAQEFERNHPLVLALGPALGLDAAGLDQLFATAAAL